MHIHILGICGTFMGGLAVLAREAGHRVTGCDAGVYPPMSEQLRALGIDLIEGYGAGQMALRPDIFVIGNVISRVHLSGGTPKFPLMEAILNAGAPYTSGPQWLAENVLQGRHVLAVAGTHGKTTTTAMLAWILEAAGHAPGFLIGGVPLDFGVSARLSAAHGAGSPPPFVIEADEYDTAFFDKRSKFVHYRPRTAILNNLEFDHADIFDDLAAIERQFHHLVRTIPGNGLIVSRAREASLERVLAQGCWSATTTFGDEGAWRAEGADDDFAVLHQGQRVGAVQWRLSGQHNRHNALAAIAAAAHIGVPPKQAAEALGRFRNVRRRMELRGSIALSGQDRHNAGRVEVYDDFAHHPSAIRTTLDGLRRWLDAHGRRDERILAVFEPRSNTMKLGTMAAQLPESLRAADLVFCYSADLDWDAAAALAPLGQRAQVSRRLDAIVQAVAAAAHPGDHIVCMSNGSFGGVHQKLLDTLTAKG
ncbi:MAG: UDP-N-acetylmuramate:L-alanyl-gamma-D-glutamyl-meso-diaminopimelate ligase [Burkholderiaceae bacterium]|jgi:UDP-N-acetylmuramate: L-alanyl-gamma-D-glutamyl-meso-diaminopimelate ligase|nr:UDP-N-acetylmuramate:L-alanyl-gamma-D-glutamyl-meso-diaminopimelate ligase [Burkholderiaceae bacterium]